MKTHQQSDRKTSRVSLKRSVPPRSPHGLIQEDLVPNEWLVLISCMMLNQTSRKQVEKIFSKFLDECGSPSSILATSDERLREIIKPLGFSNRRASNMKKMTEQYLTPGWKHVRELHGIGEYASRCWEIFFLGELGSTRPSDGALGIYWDWRMKHV